MKMRQPHDIAQELPVAFLIRMADLLGDEYDDFLTSLRQPSRPGLRVNTLKIMVSEFCQISPYKLTPLPWCPSGFILDETVSGSQSISPGKHPYHNAGLYYLQEPSAMAAAELLSPVPGEKVLDLAAAPGGKSTHIAGLMKNNGLLVANEIHPDRVWDLSENLERSGVTNAIVTNETPRRLADHFGDYFDRVMLDAPCSGEGMFRKSENARREWKPELPQSCALRQSAILDQAARLVKPGGCIAYTTCTFSPEENEAVIYRFLNRHPEFDMKELELFPNMQPARPEWISLAHDHKLNRAVRIWPHDSPGEGHFIAVLVKTQSFDEQLQADSPTSGITHRKKPKTKDISLSYKLLADFASKYLDISFQFKDIDLVGSYVYCLPKRAPFIAGLKVIHPGWWLGSIQKTRFIPSHALAMAMRSDQAKYTVELQPGDRKIASYLAGESFTSPGDNGWVLVTMNGYPLGWGKRVAGVVKNYYPRGLRRVT